MPERDSKATGMEWATAWIEQQRELLRQSASAAHSTTHSMSQGDGAAADPAPAGPAPAGEGEPAAASQSTSSPFGSFSGSFEEMLKTWRGAWTSAAGAQHASTMQFAELLGRVPAIGPLREHTETWREVVAAQAECQRLEQELRVVLLGVQNDALNLVQERLRERPHEQNPKQDPFKYRDLYNLWVECGEQVYAKVAHSEAYCKLQAELGNAAMRLRARQQQVIEHWLKQFDLPTRAELNTVHRQLRDQKAQLREHKELLAGFVERMKAPPAARPKKRTAKRTAR
jgi:class III poly(R)-hydroxyalkanoic acid synthase PhaE subunit